MEEANDLMDKLERVERTVNIYNKENKDEVEEIYIYIPLERLKSIVMPKDGDPLLYRGYVLDAEQLKEISKDISGRVKPDFNLYYYVLECHGIYNW